jgi:hypothetical protein
MTNGMIPPIPLRNASAADGGATEDEDDLETGNPSLDDGESRDSEDTVENDIREAAKSAERLSE